MNSEIFDEYAKIAIKQGLIKNDLIKKAEGSEPNPRYDSLTQADIASLYGVEPDGKKDHIIDQAHPESIIIAPAYDRVNGLVENLLERQDIIHSIVTKPNHGKHIQERYVRAHEELVNELVKAAFMLDQNSQEELMALADDCALRLVKTADTWGDIIAGSVSVLGPILLGLVGVVSWPVAAGAVGIVAIVNNFGGMVDQGVKGNSEKAIEELQDIISDPDEGKGYDDKIQNMIDDIQFVMERHVNVSEFNIQGGENTNTTAAELSQGKKLIMKYREAAHSLSKRIPGWIRLLQAVQARDEESGKAKSAPVAFLSSLVEYVWTPDVKDATTALEVFRESLSLSVSTVSTLFNEVKKGAIKNQTSIEEELNTKQESLINDELPEDELSKSKLPIVKETPSQEDELPIL